MFFHLREYDKFVNNTRGQHQRTTVEVKGNLSSGLCQSHCDDSFSSFYAPNKMCE